MRRREFLATVAALGGSAALPRSALAQKYPERPVRLVIPFPPGGVYDAVGRPWAEKAAPRLGGTIVVENIGGGGGSLGAAAVARAANDGYTILLGGGGPMILNALAATRPTYDARKDFDAIDLVALTGLSIVTHASLPAKTLQELIAYAKANPGKLSYGSAGVGSMNHLAGELFKSLIGAPDIVHVPYKGAGPALNDLVGGQIPIVMANVTGQVIGLHKAGKVRMIAVTTPQRLIGAPDIPTTTEQGLPKMISQNFIGLFAPVGTPRPVIAQLARASRSALADAAYQKMLLTSGLEPVRAASPETTRQFFEAELARWAPVVKAIGLKIN
jgi:tripartite-type tricarboxylate transporter receptor subunit TctC